MKNKLLLICAALLLFIFLVFGTYAWYLYFLRSSGDLEINKNNTLRDGKIVLKDDGNNVNDTNADDVVDEEIDSVVPYKFKIVNEGRTGTYYLYIEDLPANAVNDGCTNETLLTRDKLKYQLKLNGSVIKEDYLSNVKDNIIDYRNINGLETYNYELRVFIHEEATDWIGKHYHYKIIINNNF